MKTIHLVEDEEALRELLAAYLREAGYTVVAFGDGLSAKARIAEAPDLWVLDIMLPGMDGYALIREIKKVTPQVPVIFASARSAELDRVIGLEMGGDDYMPKPFLPRELVLRVDRMLRKSSIPTEATVVPLGPYQFHRTRRAVVTPEETVSLTNKEYDLLEFLIRNRNTAVNRNAVIDAVWGADYFGSDRVVDDTIRRLRKKMPELPIEPVYGFGYVLKDADAASPEGQA